MCLHHPLRTAAKLLSAPQQIFAILLCCQEMVTFCEAGVICDTYRQKTSFVVLGAWPLQIARQKLQQPVILSVLFHPEQLANFGLEVG